MFAYMQLRGHTGSDQNIVIGHAGFNPLNGHACLYVVHMLLHIAFYHCLDMLMNPSKAKIKDDGENTYSSDDEEDNANIKSQTAWHMCSHLVQEHAPGSLQTAELAGLLTHS